MMSFLNQADSYGQGLDGTSSFINQNSEDDQNTDNENTFLEFEGPEENNHDEQSISELPDLTTPEQNLEENPRKPPSTGI